MTPLRQLELWLEWYEAARRSLARIQRLADNHWPNLPWEGGTTLGRDNQLNKLEQEEVAADARVAVARLDDLALIELFSVFEGAVRSLVAEQVREASAGLTHPLLVAAAKGMINAAERRSFAEVLNSYSQSGSIAHADLAEQVRQVRKYRNWITHGRRGKPHPTIEPRTAYRRLRSFLELISPPDPVG